MLTGPYKLFQDFWLCHQGYAVDQTSVTQTRTNFEMKSVSWLLMALNMILLMPLFGHLQI